MNKTLIFSISAAFLTLVCGGCTETNQFFDSPVKPGTSVEEPEPEPEPEPKKPNIGEIHNQQHIASEKYQDADGFVNVSSSGLYIKRVKPDFNVRAYGYSKLPELLAAFPNKYQIKRYEGKGGATIIAYKCL